MASLQAKIWFLTFLFFIQTLSLATANNKTYIIHMNHYSKPDSFPTHHQWYQSLTSTSDSILYTYTTAFHGFAAHLHPQEAESLRKLDHVLNVFEDKVYHFQTTRTPQFLGINSNFGFIEGGEFQEIERAAADVIVGVVDSGVWPESKSFDDTGLPDIPKRWKGKCKSTPNFDHKLCNKKLIGSRYFVKASEKRELKALASARDYIGHGSHTATTIAGSPVANVSVFGYARGTARGMAVHARIANYKVGSTSIESAAADVLAAIEQAILDGVDILSFSLTVGSLEPAPYYTDLLAVGAFSAMQHGIFVSCAGGNFGPTKYSLANEAPWILTVAAGSIDRVLSGFALLGNKHRIQGVTLYNGPGMGNKEVGLVYLKGKNNSSSNYCLDGTLKPSLVRGKVVLCDGGKIRDAKKSHNIRKAGGVGMITVDPLAATKALYSDADLEPTVVVSNKDGDLIKKYIETDPNPTVLLSFAGTKVGFRPSPMVADFSSRGPNKVTPGILKPDVLAPGVSILAAWSPAATPTHLKEDNRIIEYNIVSGTSMACPHASGIAALLKAAHPSWSPSAIRSAIMTTAYTLDNTNSTITDQATAQSSNPFDHGSGHINPRKAFSPGLIYDISNQDYIKLLCSLDYPLFIVQAMANDPNLTCSIKFSDIGEFNYPSFAVLFENKTIIKYARELTNVGVAGSKYKVVVIAPSGVAVTVQPTQLVFKNVGDKQKYSITFVNKKVGKPTSGEAFGSIVWSNAEYSVRSPIAVTWAYLY